jgi:hypothetical protein
MSPKHEITLVILLFYNNIFDISADIAYATWRATWCGFYGTVSGPTSPLKIRHSRGGRIFNRLTMPYIYSFFGRKVGFFIIKLGRYR